jgi:hypothetical protein
MKVDHKKVGNWLSQKGVHGRCSCCGKNEWVVGEELMQVSPFTGGNLIIGGPTMLYVAMMCKNCTNTNIFNVNLMGDVFDSASTGNASSVPTLVMPPSSNPPHQPVP